MPFRTGHAAPRSFLINADVVPSQEHHTGAVKNESGVRSVSDANFQSDAHSYLPKAVRSPSRRRIDGAIMSTLKPGTDTLGK